MEHSILRKPLKTLGLRALVDDVDSVDEKVE